LHTVRMAEGMSAQSSVPQLPDGAGVKEDKQKKVDEDDSHQLSKVITPKKKTRAKPDDKVEDQPVRSLVDIGSFDAPVVVDDVMTPVPTDYVSHVSIAKLEFRIDAITVSEHATFYEGPLQTFMMPKNLAAPGYLDRKRWSEDEVLGGHIPDDLIAAISKFAVAGYPKVEDKIDKIQPGLNNSLSLLKTKAMAPVVKRLESLQMDDFMALPMHDGSFGLADAKDKESHIAVSLSMCQVQDIKESLFLRQTIYVPAIEFYRLRRDIYRTELGYEEKAARYERATHLIKYHVQMVQREFHPDGEFIVFPRLFARWPGLTSPSIRNGIITVISAKGSPSPQLLFGRRNTTFDARILVQQPEVAATWISTVVSTLLGDTRGRFTAVLPKSSAEEALVIAFFQCAFTPKVAWYDEGRRYWSEIMSQVKWPGSPIDLVVQVDNAAGAGGGEPQWVTFLRAALGEIRAADRWVAWRPPGGRDRLRRAGLLVPAPLADVDLNLFQPDGKFSQNGTVYARMRTWVRAGVINLERCISQHYARWNFPLYTALHIAVTAIFAKAMNAMIRKAVFPMDVNLPVHHYVDLSGAGGLAFAGCGSADSEVKTATTYVAADRVLPTEWDCKYVSPATNRFFLAVDHMLHAILIYLTLPSALTRKPTVRCELAYKIWCTMWTHSSEARLLFGKVYQAFESEDFEGVAVLNNVFADRQRWATDYVPFVTTGYVVSDVMRYDSLVGSDGSGLDLRYPMPPEWTVIPPEFVLRYDISRVEWMLKKVSAVLAGVGELESVKGAVFFLLSRTLWNGMECLNAVGDAFELEPDELPSVSVHAKLKTYSAENRMIPTKLTPMVELADHKHTNKEVVNCCPLIPFARVDVVTGMFPHDTDFDSEGSLFDGVDEDLFRIRRINYVEWVYEEPVMRVHSAPGFPVISFPDM